MSKVKGIKGLASGVFYDNVFPSFLEKGQFISYGDNAVDIENTNDQSYNQIMADITTSFTLLIGIFFPSVTGGSYSDPNLFELVYNLTESRHYGWFQSIGRPG